MKINWRHPDIFVSWRALLAEFIGTAIFVFLGSMSAVFSPKVEPLSAALGHIFALLCCIHIFGPISGAHFNTAVTFGALITRNIGLTAGLAYMIVQLLGSILGASLCLGIGKSVEAAVFNPPTELADAWRGFGLEIILTFVLMITIFGTAIKPQHFSKNDGMGSVGGLIAAFPIAFALGADAMAGPLTGASMNPARAFGPQLVGNLWPRHSWIYYTAPFLGSALGALCYEFVLTKPKKLSHYASLLHIKTKSHDSDEEEEFNEKNGLLTSNASSSKEGILYTSTN